MIWISILLLIVVVIAFMALQLLRLITFIGVVFIASAFAVLVVLLALGLLSGLGSFLLSYSLSNNPVIAACLATVVGISVPVFVGRKTLQKAKRFTNGTWADSSKTWYRPSRINASNHQ